MVVWYQVFLFNTNYLYTIIWFKLTIPSYRAIGLMSRVLTNGSIDQSSIPGRVIPKTQKMVLDVALFSTQHYKVNIKDKVGQSRERSSALPNTSV